MTKVLPNDYGIRPAGRPNACFYCDQEVGAHHLDDCVAVYKKVLVQATIEYIIEVPNHWGEDEIMFHRNDSSWCSDNMIDELTEIQKNKCLCDCVKFEFIENVSGAGGYAKQKGGEDE